MQHLYDAKMVAESSSPLDDGAPDSTRLPPIPEELNAEFGELYFLCQKYVDEKTAGCTVVSEFAITLLKDQIVRNFWKMSEETNIDEAKTKTRKTRERENKISLLLTRMFKGLAKHHPLFQNKAMSEEGVLSNTYDELPVLGLNNIRKIVKTSLSDLKGYSEAGKIVVSGFVLLVFWLLASWCLFTWVPGVLSVPAERSETTKTKGFEKMPDFQDSINSGKSWTPSLGASAKTIVTNLNATSFFNDAAYKNVTTAIETIQSLTESLTGDLQHLAFQSFWSGIAVLSPIQVLLNLNLQSHISRAIENTTQKYLDEVGNLTSHFRDSKRTLQKAFHSLDASFHAFNSSTTRTNPLLKVIKFFRLSGRHPAKKHAILSSTTDEERLLIIEKTMNATRRAAEERLFVMYDLVEGFEKKVKRDIEGGEKSGWWRVVHEVKKARKLLEVGVDGITKKSEEWVTKDKGDIMALLEEVEAKKKADDVEKKEGVKF